MCPPSKIDVALRRWCHDVSTFGDGCVNFRRSMSRPSEMDVLTFEDWWPMCRPSKIGDWCVDHRRSIVDVSTFEHRCETRLLYLLKILILTIAVCELRFALQCFHDYRHCGCPVSENIACVYVVHVCLKCVCVCVRARHVRKIMPVPRASRPRNTGRTCSPRHGKLFWVIHYNRDFCWKRFVQKLLPTICLPRTNGIPTESRNVGTKLLFAILTKTLRSKLQHIRLPSSCAYPQYKYA